MIILNWNGWDDTMACLEALRETHPTAKAWLVDNGSDRDRSDEVKAAFPRVRVILLGENLGWAGGFNRALEIAGEESYEFAYLVNNDCILRPGALDAVLDVAASNERIAAVGSTLVYGREPNFVQFDGNDYELGVKRAETRAGYTPARRVSGAAMLIRLEAVQEVGPFDERFFCYFEETEWCARAIARGWLLAVSYQSVVLHHRESSDVGANAMYYLVRNRYLYLRTTGARVSLRAEWNSMYRGLRLANTARGQGDHDLARSVIDGLWDGLLGRVGKRHHGAPSVVRYVLARFWIFPTGFFRDLQAGLRARLRRVSRAGGKPLQ